MVYDETVDRVTFFISPELFNKTKNRHRCVICIPSILRPPNSPNLQYVPNVFELLKADAGSISVPVLISVMKNEIETYRLNSKKCDLPATLIYLVRPESWNERGVRFARESLIICASHFYPNAPSLQIDDDRYSFTKYTHPTEEKDPMLQEEKSISDVVGILLSIQSCATSGILENTRIDIVAVGATHVVKNIRQAKYDLCVTTRANQTFLLPPRCDNSWLTFVSPAVRRMNQSEYQAFKTAQIVKLAVFAYKK